MSGAVAGDPGRQSAASHRPTCINDALKDIWYAPSVREGWQRWQRWQRWRAWLRHARDSGLAPLQRFACNLTRYARGILASARFPMHTSLLEGVSNRIKVINRMVRISAHRDRPFR